MNNSSQQLSLGTTFGAVSGILTAIGLILSSFGEHIDIHIIIIMLVSLAFSNGLSDAIGIFNSSYVNDGNYKKAVIEAIKTFIVNAMIPFIFAVIFIVSRNITVGSYINIVVAFIIFMFVNTRIFKTWTERGFNMAMFIFIVVGNYYIGKATIKHRTKK